MEPQPRDFADMLKDFVINDTWAMPPRESAILAAACDLAPGLRLTGARHSNGEPVSRFLTFYRRLPGTLPEDWGGALGQRGTAFGMARRAAAALASRLLRRSELSADTAPAIPPPGTLPPTAAEELST